MRKRKYHDQGKEISCLLPYGMKMPRDDVKLIRFIISQQRPFSSLYDQGSNCSLLEKKSNIIMGDVWVITASVELFFGNGMILGIAEFLDAGFLTTFSNLNFFLK